MSEPYPASSRCLGTFAGWVSPPRNLNQTSGIPPARGLNPFCESTKSGADLEQGAVGGAHGRIREGSRLPLQGADIVNFEEGEGLLAMQQWRWLDVDESLGEIGIRGEMLWRGNQGRSDMHRLLGRLTTHCHTDFRTFCAIERVYFHCGAFANAFSDASGSFVGQQKPFVFPLSCFQCQMNRCTNCWFY